MRFAVVCCLLALPLVACRSDEPTQPTSNPPSGPRPALVAAPPGASVTVQVQVPASMRTAPFDVARFLTIPPNFSIAVYARPGGARFMTVAPNGDLLVSQPNAGKVKIIRPNGAGDPLISDFVTGLSRPHDLVFHTIGSTSYLYVAEKNQIDRYVYHNGDLTGQQRQVIITGLPDASLPELHGTYGHELKNIALDGNDKLYVSIASTCNACIEDTQSNPVRGAIYQYNADGSGGQLFARGLRNAEGLAFLPGTNTLWAVVNNRDNIPYPFNDASGNYGKVVPSYVDNHPPELFTRIRSGGNYGWPFCNSDPDTPNGYVDMPFDRDFDFNASGQVNCGTMDRTNLGIQAHSAPLGLLFLQNTAVPQAYRSGAIAGLHGSWNRTQKTGYKLIYSPWDAAVQLPSTPIDLVTGWLTGNTAWGRPVDAAVNSAGEIFISDDQNGTIYKLRPTTAPPPFDATFEAESALLHGVIVGTAFGGYTGTGYVSYQHPSGDYIEWTFSVPAAGSYTLTFRYSQKYSDRPLAIAVNGQTVAASLSFPVTGGWGIWKTVQVTAQLPAGTIKLRATSIGKSGGHLDNVRVH